MTQKQTPRGEHKEFCLSDVIKGNEDEMLGWIETEDVKEFIKRLKKELFRSDAVNDEKPVWGIIDKLAGKKLI